MKKLSVCFLLIVFAFLSNASVFAIGVYPPILEVELAAGESTSTNITIYNSFNEDVKVNTVFLAWESNASVDIKEWVDFDSSEVILSPKQRITKVITIKPTSNVSVFSGEYRAYIYFNEYKQNSSYAVQLGLPVYIISSTGKKIDTRLKNVNFKYNEDTSEVIADVSFVNSGNVHVRPDLIVKLKNVDSGKYLIDETGKEDFVIAKDWPIFPDTERVISNPIPGIKNLVHGKYIAELQLKYIYLFNTIESITRNIEVDL